MRRSIFKAGAVTVLGLAIAFAIVSANSDARHAATTAAKADDAVATVPVSTDECTSSDVCCAEVTKATKTVVAAAPKHAKKAEARPGVGGLVVAIDPETGELGMPNAQQMNELEGQIIPVDDLNHSDAGLQLRRHADGSISVDLQGRFQEFSTVQILPNGQKAFGCTNDPKLLNDLHTHDAPSGLEEK